MAQMVAGRGQRMTPTGVVTVADLLTRNAPVAVGADVDESSPGISVGSLLRREGRAPHALDRPVQPRQHQQPDQPAAPAVRKRTVARRSAVAAGALLAAGSVFGAAVVSTSVGTGDALDRSYPGEGRLDRYGAPVALPGSAVIGPRAVANPLDAGIPAPMSWAAVAFPSALAGIPAADAMSPAAGVQDGSRGSSTPAGGAPPASGTGKPAGPGGQGGGGSTPTAPTAPAPQRAGGVVEDLTGTAGGTVGQITEALPAPVQQPAQQLAGAVGRTGSTLGSATAPVTEALAPVTSPVTSLLSGGAPARSSTASAPVAELPALSSLDSGPTTGRVGGVGRVAAGLLG